MNSESDSLQQFYLGKFVLQIHLPEDAKDYYSNGKDLIRAAPATGTLYPPSGSFQAGYTVLQ